MTVIAWTGVGIGVMVLVVWFLLTINGLLTSPVGRSFLIGWSLVGAAVWGAVSALYLIARAL